MVPNRRLSARVPAGKRPDPVGRVAPGPGGPYRSLGPIGSGVNPVRAACLRTWKMQLTELRKTMRGANVLLLEDDALISIDAEDMLLAIGAQRVFVAHSLEGGGSILAREPVDAALLDVVIGRGTCDALARGLAARGIPFVLASGYGDRSELPEHLRHVPHVLKPYSTEALIGAFASLGLAVEAEPSGG